MKNKLAKKGQTVMGLPTQIFALIIVAIIIGVGATILDSAETALTTDETVAITNYTFVFSGSTATYAGAIQKGFGSFTVTSINNFTNNTIGSNNYEVNSSLGIVRLLAGASQASAQGTSPRLNVTGTFRRDVENAVYNATAGGKTGLVNVSGQLGLVGLIVIFAVIIALVIGIAFGYIGRGKGGR